MYSGKSTCTYTIKAGFIYLIHVLSVKRTPGEKTLKTQGKTLIGRNFMKIHTAKINILSLKPKYKTPNSREKTQIGVKNRPWIKDKDYCTMYSRNKNVN